MLLAGFLSFLFGAAQAFLLQKALSGILGTDFIKAMLFFLLKTVLYAAAAVLLVFCFRPYLFVCAIGFILGLPVMTACYFIYQTFCKEKKNSGGDQNENADSH